MRKKITPIPYTRLIKIFEVDGFSIVRKKVLKPFEKSDFFRINGCANNYKKETCTKSLTKACKK